MTDTHFNLLYQTAHDLIKSRYAPRKHVIAATVVGGSGKLYSAVNLDSHLRRAAVCAEGAAIAIAMSAGEEKIISLLALRYNPETDQSFVVSPCGVCRELILDYGANATIYVPNENGEPKTETASALLPDRYAKQGKKHMSSAGGIAILGAGAWGTALAQLYAAENPVVLWCRRAEQAEKISAARENTDYLPGIALNQNIRVTADVKILQAAKIILVAVPTQFVPSILLELKTYLPAAPIVIAAKGIHLATQKLLPDAVQDVLPDHKIAVLSGPNLAFEIAAGLPAAATIAANSETLAVTLAEQLRAPTFRPYASTDVIGVALAGALKNVIALAAGMVMGAGLGENARAALITRGMAEITRLGMKMNARAETFMGLSGIGDIMLTCHAAASRNFSCGFALGQGKSLSDILGMRKSVTEGVTTVEPALKLAAQHGVELPICQAVAEVVQGKMNVGAALAQLMSRPLKAE